MSLAISEIKKGVFIVVDGDPYVVLTFAHLHMGRGGAVLKTKVRNLRTGTILDHNFKSGDSLQEAEIRKLQSKFIYSKGNQYWFHETGNPANRFFITAEALEDKAILLKPEMEVTALVFIGENKEEIINIELPIKANYKVTHAPPSIRGNTSQGGTKTVTVEGGLKVSVPLFIEEGDTIRINTETGEYAERV